MCENKFSLRAKILLSFLLAWAAVAAAHVFYFSAVKRDSLNSEGESFAWREGSLPALRGRILDSQGVALAWTELYHDLAISKVPERRSRKLALEKAVAKLPFQVSLPESVPFHSKPQVLKSGLSPEELVACEKLLADFPELSVELREERRTIDYPEVKRLVGKASNAPAGGVMNGVDGEERLLDKSLCGRDGRFKVMLDKNGRWVEGTLKMLAPPVKGQDVKIALSLKEIRDGTSDGRL